jgi:Cu-Zn family superoxide dismutase
MLLLALPALALVACNQEPTAPSDTNEAASTPVAATSPPVNLLKADGAPGGSVTLEDSASGVGVTIAAAGLSPGLHGIHLHAVGKCEGPKFESAGAHWNPTGRQHGRDNPAGAHLGDLDNIEIGADGGGNSALSIEATQMAIADADGTSLVIHAQADDYKTDPSGNSGDRIACAVISPPK